MPALCYNYHLITHTDQAQVMYMPSYQRPEIQRHFQEPQPVQAQSMFIPRAPNHVPWYQQPQIAQTQSMYGPQNQRPVAQVMEGPGQPFYPQRHSSQYNSPAVATSQSHAQTHIQSWPDPNPQNEDQKSKRVLDLVGELQSLTTSDVHLPHLPKGGVMDVNLVVPPETMDPPMIEEHPTDDMDEVVSLPPIIEEPDDDSDGGDGDGDNGDGGDGDGDGSDSDGTGDGDSSSKRHHGFKVDIGLKHSNNTSPGMIINIL